MKKVLVIFRLSAMFLFTCESASADTIQLWVRAFIPNSGPSAIVSVPGHAQQTMLRGPAAIGCFLTDQRGFDPALGKSARMTSTIKFDLTAAGVSNVSQSHQTGMTVEVHCASGSTSGLCLDQAKSLGMKFSDIAFDTSQKVLSFILEGRASNPCFNYGPVNPSPDIHYKILYSFDTITRGWGATAIMGQFPAFEGYMRVGASPTVTMFRAPAAEFSGGVGIWADRSDIEVVGHY